jgi:hypothetical protein
MELCSYFAVAVANIVAKNLFARDATTFAVTTLLPPAYSKDCSKDQRSNLSATVASGGK